MKTKMYGFFIERTVVKTNENGKETREKEILPCRVNAATPFNHRMLK